MNVCQLLHRVLCFKPVSANHEVLKHLLDQVLLKVVVSSALHILFEHAHRPVVVESLQASSHEGLAVELGDQLHSWLDLLLFVVGFVPQQEELLLFILLGAGLKQPIAIIV